MPPPSVQLNAWLALSSKRTPHRDAAGRHRNALRRHRRPLDDADVENLILGLSEGRCRHNDPSDESGNLGKRSHGGIIHPRASACKTFNGDVME